MRYIFLLIAVLGIGLFSNSQTIKIVKEYNLDPIRNAKVVIGEKVFFSSDYGIVTADFSASEEFTITHSLYDSIVFKTADLNAGVTEIQLFTKIAEQPGVTIRPMQWDQDESEHPGTIIPINIEDIRLNNPQTSADLLGSTDGVFIQKSQLGGGSPMIRGFSANRVLLSVDGVRMNTAIFRSGNLQNAILIDANTIESAEVILGPGTVNYGSDALGGVMDFHTFSALPDSSYKGKWKTNAMGRFSSANIENTLHANIAYRGKRFVSVTSATYSRFGDLEMGSRGNDEYVRPTYVSQVNGQDTVLVNPDSDIQVGTSYSQLNLLQKFGFKLGEKWNAEFGSHYSTSTNIPRYDRLIQESGGGLKYAEWSYGPQSWLMNHLVFSGEINKSFANKLKISLAHQFFEESRIDRRFDSDTRRVRAEKVNAFSLNVDFNKRFSDETKLFYGIEGLFNAVASEGFEENIFNGSKEEIQSRYPNGSSWSSAAAYANLQHWLNDYWHLSSGVRYNYIGLEADFDTTYFPFPFSTIQQNNHAVSGSVGAAYEFNGYHYGVNFATGFRAPNIDDIGKVFDSEPGNVIVPNPNLKPEYVYSADVNFRKKWRNEIEVSGSVYYSFLNNSIARGLGEYNGNDSLFYDGELSQVQTLQNVDFAQIYGVSASFTLPFSESFKWKNTISLTQGEDSFGDPVRHVAPTFGSSRIIYKNKRLMADVYILFNGEMKHKNLAVSEQDKAYLYAQDESGNPFSPNWFTINCKATFDVTETVVLSAGVENILDVRYRPYSSGIVAPGRNFIVSLRATF